MEETHPITLTEADYVRAQRLHFRRYYRTRRPRAALLGFVVAWAAFVWATWDDPAPAPLAALVHLGVLTILLLPIANIAVLGPLSARRAYRTNPVLARPIAYAWSDRGLRVSGAQGNWETAWGDYRSWVEDAHLILVYFAPNAFQIIPKRALDGATAASLRGHLARIVPAPEDEREMREGLRLGADLRRFGRLGLMAVTAVVWLPALLFATALIVANAAGCQLNEARVMPCVIAGIDFGAPLTMMGIMGWLVLALLPFMALTLVGRVGWGAVLLIKAARRAAARRAAEFGPDRAS